MAKPEKEPETKPAMLVSGTFVNFDHPELESVFNDAKFSGTHAFHFLIDGIRHPVILQVDQKGIVLTTRLFAQTIRVNETDTEHL